MQQHDPLVFRFRRAAQQQGKMIEAWYSHNPNLPSKGEEMLYA
jgi:hypothetical protein